jgi:MFS superfamily sulfate permease-like transporter
MTAANDPNGVAKYIPIVSWLHAYKRGWLRFDLVAGLTTAAVVIPQAMAYATIAMQSATVLASVVPVGDGSLGKPK